MAAYWAAAQARDWAAFGALVAAGVVYEAPQTRERVRGRAAYIRFNSEGFGRGWGPGRPAHRRERPSQAASWVQFTEPDGSYPGVCFFELDEAGLITSITDFWPRPEVPASRAPRRALLAASGGRCSALRPHADSLAAPAGRGGVNPQGVARG